MEMDLTTKGLIEPRAGQVDVWLTSLSGISNSEQYACLRLLNDPERARWHRFLVEDARLQYLVTRALVRTTLSRYADVQAQTWEFETNAYGRPYIAQPEAFRNLRFNLSNATGLIACVVSGDCEIGVDVECITRTVNIEELAPTVLAPAELADFRRSLSHDRPNRFFSYWTLKESYIKARGMGLSIPLDAFWFELGGSSPRLFVTDRCSDRPERWRFYQYAPTDEHVMAIAAAAPQGCEPFIHLRWLTPSSMSPQFL
jgi:4'-phosphopantetheinyl transferase